MLPYACPDGDGITHQVSNGPLRVIAVDARRHGHCSQKSPACQAGDFFCSYSPLFVHFLRFPHGGLNRPAAGSARPASTRVVTLRPSRWLEPFSILTSRGAIISAATANAFALPRVDAGPRSAAPSPVGWGPLPPPPPAPRGGGDAPLVMIFIFPVHALFAGVFPATFAPSLLRLSGKAPLWFRLRGSGDHAPDRPARILRTLPRRRPCGPYGG